MNTKAYAAGYQIVFDQTYYSEGNDSYSEYGNGRIWASMLIDNHPDVSNNVADISFLLPPTANK